MQRRYCACGRMVLVRYRVGVWVAQATFWDHAPQRSPLKIKIGQCPRCGINLNIDDLQ